MSASARTRIKARLLPRFPAAINGGLMIDATREGSALTLAFTMARLGDASAPELGWRLPAYDPVADVYRSVTIGTVATGAPVPLSQISDMSADARTFNAAASFPAMRTALGAAATSHTHSATQLTDSQAFGRSMLGTATAAAGTALLDTFTASTKGLAPASGGGTSAYLRADGTWTVPGGSGDVVGPASATDNAAARFDATTGKLIQGSPLVIADTTGALSRIGGGGIAVQGTNTNDSAASGFVGEVVESTVLFGAAVSLTSGAAANVTSITLTPGDWDVFGAVAFNPGGTPSRLSGWISATSATFPSSPNQGAMVDLQSSFAAGASCTLPVGLRRFSVNTNTQVFLTAFSAFSSTMGAYGYIGARRVR